MSRHWPCVSDEMSQHRKELRQGRKLDDEIRKEKKSHRSECPLSRRCLCSRAWRSCHRFHLPKLLSLGSRRRSWHCVCDEIGQHTKQLRQGKKIRRKKKNSPIWVPPQRRYALTSLCVPDLKCLVRAAACYFCAAWAVNHRLDPAFRWDESARETTKKKKKRKKISPIWVPPQRALRSVRLKKKFTDRFF